MPSHVISVEIVIREPVGLTDGAWSSERARFACDGASFRERPCPLTVVAALKELASGAEGVKGVAEIDSLANFCTKAGVRSRKELSMGPGCGGKALKSIPLAPR
jgi:hypothetical protein